MDQDRLLRERLSRLGEAGLRINESLKFETVLQGVLNSPCALTEARYGALTPDLLTPGLTLEEAQGSVPAGGPDALPVGYSASVGVLSRHGPPVPLARMAGVHLQQETPRTRLLTRSVSLCVWPYRLSTLRRGRLTSPAGAVSPWSIESARRR